MKRTKLIYGVAVTVIVALWAAFRPERLLLNTTVKKYL